MNVIEQMLTGQIKMEQFILLLKSDSSLQDDLRSLIPLEATNNRTHIFWRCISYDSLKNHSFDFVKLLGQIASFNGGIADNLNIFGSIRAVYLYYHPSLKCTHTYDDAFDLYLTVVKDCFDGPEVSNIVDLIIYKALEIQSKRKQIAQAKKDIQIQFHTEGTKLPHWIQGAEWPMGSHSPMRFISQKRSGETVQYLFEDVDTQETRTVEQFY